MDSGKMMGWLVYSSMSCTTSWSKVPGMVDTPMMASGLKALMADLRSGWKVTSWAKGSLWCCRPVGGWGARG